MFLLYIASAQIYLLKNILKIGITEEPYGRRTTYRTGCPPGLTPSHDIDYITIWETSATSRDELHHFEDIVHNELITYRMMRDIPGDSEWFDFKDSIPLQSVIDFITSLPFIKRTIPLQEIIKVKNPNQYLSKQHAKNTAYISAYDKRISVLELEQQPFIHDIGQCIKHRDGAAGIFIAPCGIGKTIMTCKAMKQQKILRVIICCPSNKIQEQWKQTLLSESVFTKEHILLVGSTGTTDTKEITNFLQKEVCCIIITYMSSYLLYEHVESSRVELIVNDEVHHLVGQVAVEDQGIGITRRLMQKTVDCNITRVSLTFTPRFIRNELETYQDEDDSTIYLSMDDERIFGPVRSKIQYREMIKKGLLPDYRVWTLRDESKKGMDIIGKSQCIIDAWQAKECVRGQEQFILHHLIVFTRDHNEAKQVEQYLTKHNFEDTLILYADTTKNISIVLEQFTKATRAIIINCKLLGEG